VKSRDDKRRRNATLKKSRWLVKITKKALDHDRN